jgi:signal transduction histidine kinase
LDVAKLESGTMEVERQEIAAERFVDDCIQQVELWARGDGIQLAKEISLEKLYLDPTLTSRVVVNLLGNALKFSPEGSTVTVRLTLSHGAARFSIADQGPGIPAEFADVIFEPFSQVKGTQGGTGLGLTFCRVAVQAQGGKIWVESHHGQGTIMHFTIPQHA